MFTTLVPAGLSLVLGFIAVLVVQVQLHLPLRFWAVGGVAALGLVALGVWLMSLGARWHKWLGRVLGGAIVGLALIVWLTGHSEETRYLSLFLGDGLVSLLIMVLTLGSQRLVKKHGLYNAVVSGVMVGGVGLMGWCLYSTIATTLPNLNVVLVEMTISGLAVIFGGLAFDGHYRWPWMVGLGMWQGWAALLLVGFASLMSVSQPFFRLVGPWLAGPQVVQCGQFNTPLREVSSGIIVFSATETCAMQSFSQQQPFVSEECGAADGIYCRARVATATGELYVAQWGVGRWGEDYYIPFYRCPAPRVEAGWALICE